MAIALFGGGPVHFDFYYDGVKHVVIAHNPHTNVTYDFTDFLKDDFTWAYAWSPNKFSVLISYDTALNYQVGVN
jgi:hypothetical protein